MQNETHKSKKYNAEEKLQKAGRVEGGQLK